MPGVFKNKLTRTLIVSIIISIITSILLVSGFLNTWEYKISDALYTPSNTLDNIVIIAIDDESLQDLGRWPWPRNYFADVIDYLNQSSVIGIDVSFFETSEKDPDLAKSLKSSNVVLAMEYTSFSYRDGDLYGETLLKPATTLGISGEDFSTGYVNLFTDTDGVTRSFTPHIKGIEDHDHFSVVVANEFTGVPTKLEDKRMLINFFGNPGDYTHISFSDVYNKKINQSYFIGKIVLIGATASDLHDNVIVPISNEAMPGVEVNANLVQSILTRDYLFYQDDPITIGVIFIFALITGIILFRFRIHIATIILLTLIIAYVLISIFTFDTGLILNILYPILAIILVYISLVVLYYLTEERSRKWITSVFGKYVSPVVIDSLIKNPKMINLGGEKRDITILLTEKKSFFSFPSFF